MSGSEMGRRGPQPERELTPAEQHLGDRLAALIDGELGHDARERVLSHLATCCSCKTEADAQRRVKNVFADTAPPPPSDGLLARLQGLPAGGPDGPGDGSGSGADVFSRGAASSSPDTGGSALAFDYLRGGGGALSVSRGFRIHEMDRLTSRGRRFAFAAAGAVSLAALALGGGLGSGSTATNAPALAKGDSPGASASSVRSGASASAAERERRRRDAGGARSERSSSVLSVSTEVAGATGASITAGRDSAFHRGAPWAAPSAPSGAQEQADTIHPLLRDALFASPLTRSALPSVTYNSYGYESYAGTPMSGASAGGSTEHAPAPSPVATAAPPQG